MASKRKSDAAAGESKRPKASASRLHLFVVVGCPLSVFLSTPDLLALASTCRACRTLPRVADWAFKYRQRWGGLVCAVSQERFRERLSIRRRVGRALSILRNTVLHAFPDRPVLSVPVMDPPFSQARRDLLSTIEERVAGCRFSEEWVEYLDMLPTFVADCSGFSVSLHDPLAIVDYNLNDHTVLGLGPICGGRLERFLPLSLGFIAGAGTGLIFCYYDLESNERPAFVVVTDSNDIMFDGVCDRWIQQAIGARQPGFASPAEMLATFHTLVKRDHNLP
jgi:hypothetical protein